MAWRENRSILGGKARRHSSAAIKGHRKRKIKKKIKNYVARKILSSVVGAPGLTDIVEEKKD